MNANKSIIRFAYYASMLSVFIILVLKLKLVGGTDDQFFMNALKNEGLIDFLYNRYETWSGRVFLELVLVETINLKLVWITAIPLSVILCAHLMWSISLRGFIKKHIGVMISLLLLMIISQDVAIKAQWWVTGFYNYLLPLTCALFLINSLINNINKKFVVVTASILSLVATSSEQVAVMLLISIPAIYVGKNKYINRPTAWIYFVCVAIGSSITLLSPGSVARFYIESNSFMPGIVDMNIFQKGIIGIDRLVENSIAGRNLSFIVSIVSFVSFILMKGKNTVLNKLLLAMSFIAVTIICIGNSPYLRDIETLNYSIRMYLVDFGSLSLYAILSFYTLLIIGMAVGTIEQDDHNPNYDCAIVIAIGVMCTLAIGLSPTAYASGGRVFYIWNIALSIYTLLIIKRMVRK